MKTNCNFVDLSFIFLSCRLKKEDFVKLSHIIITIFNKDTESASVYYSPAEFGHPAKGKLFNAYFNKKNSLSQAGVITRRKLSNNKGQTQVASTDNQLLDDTELEIQSHIVFLTKNIVPWEKVVESWERTIHKRMQILDTNISTKEYLEKFPCLTEPNSFELVSGTYYIKFHK